VRDRVGLLGGTLGFAHLAGDQLGEGLGDDPHRVGAQPRHQPRGGGEQVVAGQDCDVVAPPQVGAGCAPAHLRLVHHVVVVERGQMHQLDHRTGDRHLVGVRIRPQLRRQHREQGPESFAAGLEQVQHGVCHQVV
jgi:hypothetical protein